MIKEVSLEKIGEQSCQLEAMGVGRRGHLILCRRMEDGAVRRALAETDHGACDTMGLHFPESPFQSDIYLRNHHLVRTMAQSFGVTSSSDCPLRTVGPQSGETLFALSDKTRRQFKLALPYAK